MVLMSLRLYVTSVLTTKLSRLSMARLKRLAGNCLPTGSLKYCDVSEDDKQHQTGYHQ